MYYDLISETIPEIMREIRERDVECRARVDSPV
jgi:hypothetical protein